MGEIFLKLLNMSITAGWLILAVLCFRLLFRRIPKWVNCLLWGVVAIRLICPISIESQFSVLPSTEPIKSATFTGGEYQKYIPSIDSNLTIVENTINPILAENFAYDAPESVAPLQVLTFAIGIAWCGGMIGLMGYALVSALRLRYLVREAVCYRDKIFVCDAVKTPFILGIIRPRIYLSSSVRAKDLDYIIAHELAHLKRKDHWWKPIGYLLLCVYWFQPLCWVAYVLFCKDIELACDEKVIKSMTFDEKKQYSKVLLSCSQQRRLVMSCPLAFGEVGVKERVKSVLNYKKPSFWIVVAAIVVCLIMAVSFLTTPPKEYQIRVTIPAGSTERFCYSDEEICPKGNALTLYAGEGLGDTSIVLLPVEVRKENAYDEATYITPGMPVKMEVEKGAWFKIGVSMQNPSEENIDVYVSVSNVDVRIASTEVNNKTPLFDGTDSNTATDYILPGESGNGGTMLVSNILTDSNLVAVSREDADMIQAYINLGDWNDEANTDCLSNCELHFDGQTIEYHSDCGTFNDTVQQRYLRLDDEAKETINKILEKYIELDSDEVTVVTNISEEDSLVDNNIDKDSMYFKYLEEKVESAVKEDYEISDCEVDISYLNDEIVSVDVRIVPKDDEIKDYETDLRDAISKFLGIATESIELLLPMS